MLINVVWCVSPIKRWNLSGAGCVRRADCLNEPLMGEQQIPAMRYDSNTTTNCLLERYTYLSFYNSTAVLSVVLYVPSGIELNCEYHITGGLVQ